MKEEALPVASKKGRGPLGGRSSRISPREGGETLCLHITLRRRWGEAVGGKCGYVRCNWTVNGLEGEAGNVADAGFLHRRMADGPSSSRSLPGALLRSPPDPKENENSRRVVSKLA